MNLSAPLTQAECAEAIARLQRGEALEAAGEPWRYHFKFLSPQDYTHFFQVVAEKTNLPSWKSTLMQALD